MWLPHTLAQGRPANSLEYQITKNNQQATLDTPFLALCTVYRLYAQPLHIAHVHVRQRRLSSNKTKTFI